MCYLPQMRTSHRLALLLITAATLVVGTGVASAQEVGDPYAGPTSTVVTSTSVLTPEEPEVLGATQSAGDSAAAGATSGEVQGTALAFTGGDVTALLVVGGVALLVGIVLVAGRRRATATA